MADFVGPKRRPQCEVDHDNQIELVLLGGGAKGPGHLGLLKALDERKINIGMVTGVSIGSCVAALYTNGYDADQILEIMRTGMARLNPLNPDKDLLQPGPFSLSIGQSRFINLHRLYTQIQAQYNLKPNPQLRIMTYDLLRRETVVFEGTDYDLPMALAASCAIPGIMSPIWMGQKDKSGWLDVIHGLMHDHGDQLLIDGGVQDFDPEYFCNRPCIISKIGCATKCPPSSDKITTFVRLWHYGEMLVGKMLDRKKDKDEKHITVPVGLPNVCAINFALSPERYQEMVQFGYRNACTQFDAALAKGVLPTRKD